jgi:LacI family transcriptional regulator
MNSIDIAKLAGVSRSTVSRVINNYTNVPEETRKKVVEVIEKYNYVPHASARMLAGAKNRCIGLFIVDMKTDLQGKQVSASYYFSPMTSAIIDYANDNEYNVLVSIVSKPRDFQKVKETFFDKTIAGGIFVGVRDNEQEIKDIIAGGHRVVIVDQSIKSNDEIYNKSIIINADNFNGAYKATEYLIKLGHKNIAHVMGVKNQSSSVERMDGYKKALTDFGIKVNSKYIVKGNFTVDSGYNATKKLLANNRPSAIFLSNDSMAIGAMQAIEETGLKIPDDISVIGFDDIEVARYIKPSLTTVKMDLFEMASIAINNLISSIESNLSFSACYTVPVDLIERETCKKLKNDC